MSKFIMMVGLPASGKSTLARQLSMQENGVILSSDELREELFGDVNDQSQNVRVFEEMNKRANTHLLLGDTVIYDATNLTRKKRVHLINHVIKANEKVAYYINNHLTHIQYQDEHRTRKVGSSVIDKMYKSLHIPVMNEGWDDVIYFNDGVGRASETRNALEAAVTSGAAHDELITHLATVIPEFMDIFNVSQDSTYHSFSISRHIYYVYKYVLEKYEGDNQLIMLWAALFHDLGKGYCKSFTTRKGEETRYAHFIGHEFVSSQLAAYWLTQLGYDDSIVQRVSALVQFHMIPLGASEKKMKEIHDLLGADLFQKLLFLHEADMAGK
ncbi:AAA family ATPase [Priestia koreensis]|uniref:AAA family ATPase n=1 Tax=Priestia koreensis TaxID=284581 RepID=UPI0028F713DA|nr:AAA family ATPase [Priestia koreensis]